MSLPRAGVVMLAATSALAFDFRGRQSRRGPAPDDTLNRHSAETAHGNIDPVERLRDLDLYRYGAKVVAPAVHRTGRGQPTGAIQTGTDLGKGRCEMNRGRD